MPLKVVDLFAGPGGLGEGFSSIAERFQIVISAEKDYSAHKTLRLRSFYRLLMHYNHDSLEHYYQYLHGLQVQPYNDNSKHIWDLASKEAQQIELGTSSGNNRLDAILDSVLESNDTWVLIGGPPCQAYSLAGRSRNKGIKGYTAAADSRHFLYKEYLRVIAKYSPSVFIMENVKGILSSEVGGERIFPKILKDLGNPQQALSIEENGQKYIICSLTEDFVVHPQERISKAETAKFIIKADEFGVPQARHRVILLGIREDCFKDFEHLRPQPRISVLSAISDLPQLRSKLSKEPDSSDSWEAVVKEHLKSLLNDPIIQQQKDMALKSEFHSIDCRLSKGLSSGGLRVKKSLTNQKSQLPESLRCWYEDNSMKVWLNHESRGHMSSDLRRYLFASAFAKAYGRSPKGHEDFKLNGLAPNHKNWRTGHFSDRFRVQVENIPATTITSHISKDGHYFIHPDPAQCRSLTVREAARLQTFPDNYFFEGNRTQQYHQVGNAVPSFLAHQIAHIVSDLLS